MTADRHALSAALSHSRVRTVFAPGALGQVGELARELSAKRALLVTDRGIVAAGHVERALTFLRRADIEVTVFDGVEENPTTAHVARGVDAARSANVDLLIGLGGGSSMDCAKGINFILTNGGTMADYWGVNKATKSMLPLIAIPTTAGTGSEAQSFALICDAATHQKMACGDEKALPKAAILDPDLTATQPRPVAAATGIDAVSHAVETAATTRRSDISLALTREAWARLEPSFERAMANPLDDQAREGMLLGAHLAGAAIEKSMLGAAHACANPLTRRFGIVHGVAIGVLLPHVVRFNSSNGPNPYAALDSDPQRLARRIETMLDAAQLPRRLRDCNVDRAALDDLAEEAAAQWTAKFNPLPVAAPELRAIYENAY